MATARQTLNRLIRHAMGGEYDPASLPEWLQQLRNAVVQSQPSDSTIRRQVSRWLTSRFNSALTKAHLARTVPQVTKFTVDSIEPQLRAELDRRILQSIDLIKLDRDQRVAQTMHRFAGWLSSMPPGGTAAPIVRKHGAEVLKPTLRQRFEQRRVEIDQGHKLMAAVDNAVGQAAGAIAGMWQDRGVRDKSYDARPEHLARSGKIFVVRGSWADLKGLIKHPNGYTDQIEQPAELPFCSCKYIWLSSLSSLPPAMLTERGRAALESMKHADQVS